MQDLYALDVVESRSSSKGYNHVISIFDYSKVNNIIVSHYTAVK
ncbi:hypothetical protein NARC_170003 [Candidatus Nitrosocosmicus arcticus]|uniref:Uncharacterized protein n=1 Tax=Candidatus Nitrosocosmicus arcticus TaxID=2035267 RepID=A0A557SRM8_9ARCH|nr:hypothetical protein NARC_170003 [Candidatus Nitrosocosmicus arcticus]